MWRELGEIKCLGLVGYIYIFFWDVTEPLGSPTKSSHWKIAGCFFNCRGDSCHRYVPYIRRFVSRAEAFGEEARTIPWDPDHGIVCKKTTAGNVEESFFFLAKQRRR